jgi:SAM-dependent methyltransferase
LTATLTHDVLAPDIETSSAGYHRRFAGPVGRYFLEAQAEAVGRLIHRTERRPLRVLEIGGGHGQLTPYLLGWGHDVWVHGSDATCRQQIEPLLARHPDRLHFVTADLWSLPFEDGCFDLVIAMRVLAHVERWLELLAEMSRLSRGQLLIDFAPRASWNVLTPVLLRVKHRIEGNTRPYFCYFAGRLQRALRDLGLPNTTLHKQFFLPMGMHRLVNRRTISTLLEGTCRWLGFTRLWGSPVLLLADRGPTEADVSADSKPLESIS